MTTSHLAPPWYVRHFNLRIAQYHTVVRAIRTRRVRCTAAHGTFRAMAPSKGIAAFIATTTIAAALAGVTCAAPRPMASEGCGRVPDVNDCIFIAGFITDRCLSDCVVRQCAAGHLRCDQETAAHWAMRADAGQRVGGFVPKGDRSCKEASDEIKWCDLNVTSSCKVQMAVHEIAHACGWHHRNGFNVPGDNGGVECR